MGRRHFHPAACKVCGRKSADGWHISQTGLCLDDAKARLNENLDGLKSMSGPSAAHWRRRLAASVGAVLLDEPRPSEQTASDA